MNSPIEWAPIIEGAPIPVVVTEVSGLVAEANERARFLGALPGRWLRPVVPEIGRQELDDGRTVHYFVGSEGADAGEPSFSLEVADALAGLLNVSRVLRRIVDLALGRLGSFAAVVVRAGDELRCMTGRHGVFGERVIPLEALDDRLRKGLEESFSGGEASLEHLDELLSVGIAREQALDEGPLEARVAPLRARGRVLGVLLVGGSDAAVGNSVDALARRGAVALDAAQAFEERAALAATLRTSLLPPPLPRVPGVELGATYRAAQEAVEIGGDFYEVLNERGAWSVTIGDVCGKGVDAAVLTGQVRQSLRTVALLTEDPAERLRLVNETMLRNDARSYVTLAHARLCPGPDGIEVTLAVGGHPPPLRRLSDGTVAQLDATGMLVGLLPDVELTTQQLTLRSGETLLFYTDGLVDARGARDRFGLERVCELLAACDQMKAQAIAERLMQGSIEHLDGRGHDDIAVLAVQGR